jgi:DNA-directed RNA polymerase subunit RPC12/RpoP
MYQCWECGHTVDWIGDFLESEVMGDLLPDQEDRLAALYRCDRCGSDFIFYKGTIDYGKEEKE